VKRKRLPLPRRYSHSGSGAAAAAPLWTSLEELKILIKSSTNVTLLF
jgi:hypothetical protein